MDRAVEDTMKKKGTELVHDSSVSVVLSVQVMAYSSLSVSRHVIDMIVHFRSLACCLLSFVT